MADEIQNLPEITQTTQSNGKITETNAPAPTQVNDGPTPGNPDVPAGARSITKNTMVGFSNDNLSHGAEFKVLANNQTSSLKYGVSNSDFTGSSGIISM